MSVQPPDFEARYATDGDPFAVRTSHYERRKIDVVVASLTQREYRFAWDVACGTGDLALALTERADHVHATDAAPTAVALTADLLRSPSPTEHAQCTQQEQRAQHEERVRHATTAVNRLPHAPGIVDVDLVVLSEVCYYLPEAERTATYALADTVAATDAEIVSVTWRHRPGDAQLSGADQSAELLAWFAARGWSLASRHDDTDFVAVHLVRGRYRTPRPGAVDTPRGGPA